MKNRWIWGIVGIVAVAFTSCQKDPLKNLTASESRIYITNRDSSISFSSFKTFSIVDSAGVIQDGQGDGKALTEYDAAVISALKTALVKRGFQEVDRSASPDLASTYQGYTALPPVSSAIPLTGAIMEVTMILTTGVMEDTATTIPLITANPITMCTRSPKACLLLMH